MDLLPDIVPGRHCLYCNKTIRGRSDKKFCNDQCRNLFNNQLNSSSSNYMRCIDNQLRRNRRILQYMLGEKRFVVAHISSLSSNGFALAYCTHTRTAPNGIVYRFCYEYGYTILSKGRLRIVYRLRLNAKAAAEG